MHFSGQIDRRFLQMACERQRIGGRLPKQRDAGVFGGCGQPTGGRGRAVEGDQGLVKKSRKIARRRISALFAFQWCVSLNSDGALTLGPWVLF